MKDIILFTESSLNTDVDPKLLQKGDSDYRLNCSVSNDGRYYIITNSLGNSQKVDFSSISNTVAPIGWCADNIRNRFIFFLHDSTVDYIYYYDFFLNTFNLILSGDYLGWDGSFIDNPQIVEDLLYWTDNVAPRKINYVRAYNYTNSVVTEYKYYSLSSTIISAYKDAPVPPYEITRVNGYNEESTIKQGSSFQWALRYIYTDNEKSVLSPYSSMYRSDTIDVPYVNGIYKQENYYRTKYFVLKIAFAPEDVVACEIYVRSSDKSNWYLYDTVEAPQKEFSGTINSSNLLEIRVSSEIYSQYQIGVELYNSGVGSFGYITDKYVSSGNYIFLMEYSKPAATYDIIHLGMMKYRYDDSKLKSLGNIDDLTRPFDYIPTLAGKQELIEKNRIIYGDITEGFDNITCNVDSTVVISDNMGLDSQTSTLQTSFPFPYQYFYFRWLSYSEDGLYGAYLAPYLNSKTPFTVEYLTLPSTGTGLNGINILTALASQITAKGVTASVVDYIGLKWVRITSAGSFYENGIGFLGSYFYSRSVKNTYKTFKFGDSYLAGIQYYDKNKRMFSIQKIGSINIPKLVDTGYTDGNRYATVNFSIKHIPPVDAVFYSFAFTKRVKTDFYFQFYVNGIDSSTSKFDYFFSQADGLLRIRVNKIILNELERNKLSNIKTYAFEPGDRLRIIGRRTAVGYEGITFSPIDGIDVEIKGYEWPDDDTQYLKDEATSPSYITDESGNKVKSDSSSYIVVPIKSSQLSIATLGFFAEIYRPKKEEENPLYFTHSELFGIGNPGLSNRYHMGNSQYQNPNSPVTTPAIVTGINGGDTYLKLRSLNHYFVCTDDNYSDYYESNSYGVGRPNFYDADAKKVRLISGLRYSGRLLENTKVNELNKFIYKDLVVLKSKFGTINKVIETGDVLKVLQESKETSIYVGKEEMSHPDGNKTLITSNNVLGTQNSYDEIRGTIYPNSVVVHNRDLYYFDGARGEVIRSSPNGQIPISEYGMKTYFNDISNQINASTNVCAGYDEENKIYFITFGSIATLGFYEPLNKWISFYSFKPTMYCSSGLYFGTLANGLWKHNDSAVNRCTFYGVKYKQQINWYSNIEPVIKKLFKSVGIKSNKQWSIPVISIEADSTYTRGMLSKLNTNHFKKEEGVFFASYLKNMKSTSNTPSVVDLINGDSLRGFYLKHEMENSENDEVWLLNTEVNFDISNKK